MVAAVPEPFGVPKGPFSMTYRERALRKKRRASRGPTAPAVGRCSDSDSSSSQSASPSSPFFSKTMWFEPSGWPDHSQQSWLTRVRNYLWVCCLLSWWTCELVVAAGPVRLMRWLFLLFRIVCFVVLLLYHVFLPMAWQYCTSGTILRDVPYNNDESSKGRSVLDIYLPKPAYRWISDLRKSNSHQQKRPVAIFFVGGAWIVGYKGWGALLARLLAAAGVICFVPDYRNFPQATVSDMVSDTNDAIAWVLANLETYGGDPDNVVLIGQSAGAHLGLTAMLRQARRIQHEHEKEQPEMHPSAPPLPLPESYCRGATWNPKHICSFIGVSGPYNILGMADFFQSKGLYKSVLHMIFENFDEMWSPTDLLDDLDDEALSTIPPMYLFHGTADNTVPHRSSVELAEICESLGLRYACKLLEGHSHTAPIIESPVGGDDPLMADLLHLFSNCVWGQLPSSGGFTGTMTEVFHDPHNDKKMAELSKLVPKANKALLYLARHVNPF